MSVAWASRTVSIVRRIRAWHLRIDDTAASNIPSPHSNSNNEAIVYVLEGTLRYAVGSDTRDLASGQTMHTPKGTVHGFSNLLVALRCARPDRPVSGHGLPIPRDVAAAVNAVGPPDKRALVSVMSRYGLIPPAPK